MRVHFGAAVVTASILFAVPGDSNAQAIPGGTCRPVSDKTSEVGCWIVAHQQLGTLRDPTVWWHLDVYPSRQAADAAVRDTHGTVVESFGKVWLLTISVQGWRAPGGEHVAEIGPLSVKPGHSYAAQYMEAVFKPGMTSTAHTHSGPEAWYTVSGEMCLESPEGKRVGRAGGEPVIIPEGPPMHLTATGTEIRRSLVLILHDAARPSTTLAHDWTPKGLCKG